MRKNELNVEVTCVIFHLLEFLWCDGRCPRHEMDAIVLDEQRRSTVVLYGRVFVQPNDVVVHRRGQRTERLFEIARHLSRFQIGCFQFIRINGRNISIIVLYCYILHYHITLSYYIIIIIVIILYCYVLHYHIVGLSFQPNTFNSNRNNFKSNNNGVFWQGKYQLQTNCWKCFVSFNLCKFLAIHLFQLHLLYLHALFLLLLTFSINQFDANEDNFFLLVKCRTLFGETVEFLKIYLETWVFCWKMCRFIIKRMLKDSIEICFRLTMANCDKCRFIDLITSPDIRLVSIDFIKEIIL